MGIGGLYLSGGASDLEGGDTSAHWGLRTIDALHIEIYQSEGARSGDGFAAYVEKTIHSKIRRRRRLH